MANTVNYLSYANTFGDQMVATNALVTENNNLATGTYTKTKGTLFLNDESLGLQIANNAIVGGQLQVQGIGSSVYVQNNLRVDTQVYFQNTTLGLTNTGELISNGKISAAASGTGINVANNAIIGGTLDVTGVTALGNTLTVSKATTLSNTLSVTGVSTLSSNVNAGNYVNVTNDVLARNFNASELFNGSGLNITGNGTITSYLRVGTTLNTIGSAIVNDLTSNNNTKTVTLNAIGSAYVSNLTSNNNTRTATLNSTGSAFLNDLTSNNTTRTVTLNATGSAFVNDLTSNNTTRTTTLNATGSAYVNSLSSNGSINGTNSTLTGTSGITFNSWGPALVNDLTSNNTTRTTTLNATGSAYVNNLTSNNNIRTTTLNASGTAYVNSLSSNGSISGQALSGTNLTLSGTTLSATGVDAAFKTMSVSGNFTINGTTVYNSNEFVLNANETSAKNGSFGVFRPPSSSAANAYIRWNEDQKYFELNDVVNNSALNYYRIITDQYSSDITTVYGTKNIASSNSVYFLQNIANTTNSLISIIQDTNTSQNSRIDYSNTAINIIQGVDTTQNTRLTVIEGVNASQNVRLDYSNTRMTITDGVDAGQNTAIDSTNGKMESAYAQANTVVATNGKMESAYTQANTAVTNVAATNGKMQSAYNQANTAVSNASTVSDNLAATDGKMSSAYNQANTVATNLVATDGKMQSAYDKANTGSGTFNGTTGQAIAINGVFTFKSNNGTVVSGTANSIYVNTPQDLRTTDSPTFNSLTLTNPLPFGQGGTGATTSAQALNNLLPTGTTSGYVLTTGGPGSFYWAAGGGGGGGGATPGTSIASTRISYTANGTGIAYTTPVYVPGASQLRVYIDGVRQFASEYTETTGNTNNIGIVSFNASPPSGSVILMEVDGYVINPYYANNIAFTVNSTISPTANTIQLAIDGLTSIAALKTGTTFTAPAMALTPAISVSNTQIATTAYVNNLANSGITFAHNISGTASSAQSVTALNSSSAYQAAQFISSGTTNFIAVGTSPVNNATTYNYNGIASNTANWAIGVNNNGGVFNYSGTGNFTASGSVTAYSDARLKTNVATITGALDKVSKLRGVSFERDGTKNIGVIAQEIREILPEVVIEGTDTDKILSVSYGNIVGVLIEAIKELKAEIDTLKGSK